MSIANANYMAKKLEKEYKILYRGRNGFCAHEFIIDLRDVKKQTGVTSEDVAKRLMDYGFHAPTQSFPVPDTLMLEPTESEPLSELDRLCEAMLSIREEIREVEDGKIDVQHSALRGAPHAIDVVMSDNWDRKYTRQQAASPLPYLQTKLYWPTVGRVDNVYGDKNPMCTCDAVEAYVDQPEEK
jgi:glycine dehydrogenase